MLIIIIINDIFSILSCYMITFTSPIGTPIKQPLPDCSLVEVSSMEDQGPVRIQFPDFSDLREESAHAAEAAVLGRVV